MATTTAIKLGRQTYRVVHDDQGVIRIGYTDAVSGDRNLLMDGRRAQQVLKAFEAAKAAAPSRAPRGAA